jgi:hypothetical protein
LVASKLSAELTSIQKFLAKVVSLEDGMGVDSITCIADGRGICTGRRHFPPSRERRLKPTKVTLSLANLRIYRILRFDR